MFFKAAVLKNFAIFTKNNCVGVSILIKFQARPAPLIKRDSNTGVFV